MQFLRDLYLEESLSSKKDEIVRKINNNQVIPNLYVIALSTNADNMLDIIPQWELTQKGYPCENVRVIGLAKGKKEAMDLVQHLIEETYRETGSANVRDYLNSKKEEQVWI